MERPAQWRHVRKASDVPGLSVREAEELKRAIPDATRAYLRGDITWTDQSARDIATFLEEIEEKLPFLRRYQHAWPAEAYTREYLYRRSARMKPQPKPVSRSAPRTRSLNAAQAATRREKPEAPKRPAPVVSSMVRSEARKGEEAVRAFLQSVRPAMDGLMPIFIQCGVVDDAHLMAVAKMRKKDQRKFLRRDLQLTALQTRLIQPALRDMISSSCS